MSRLILGLFSIPLAVMGTLLAAMVAALGSLVVLPLILFITGPLGVENKDDVGLFGDLLLFGVPVAFAYLMVGADWAERSHRSR